MQNQWDYYSMVGFAPETHSPEELERLTITPEDTALFLDFDGTLIDIAPTPDAIRIGDDDKKLLSALSERHNGAVSIVSGRNLKDVEQYLEEFTGTVSGGHGAELRHRSVQVPCIECDLERLEHIKNVVREFAIINPQLIAEDKSFGIVLHFRQDPSLEAKVREFLTGLVEGDDEFGLQSAKLAIEIKPKCTSKADVIERIMNFDEFAGRNVLFAGDDETDEAGFAWVNERGGVSVKVGDGLTCAHYRTQSPETFKHWLWSQAGATGS